MTGLGTFAEAITTSESSVVKVESDLPDAQLALIGCGVTTGVGAALNTASVKPGSTVAVLGCGGVGQAVIQGARIAGAARIIAIDPQELKRKQAKAFGATDVVDPVAGRPGGAGEGAHRRARRRLRLRGHRPAGDDPHDLQPGAARRRGHHRRHGRLDAQVTFPAFQLFFEEKKILGCKYGSAQVRRDFPRFIDLIETGRLDTADGVEEDQARRGERRLPRHGGGRSHPQRDRLIRHCGAARGDRLG